MERMRNGLPVSITGVPNDATAAACGDNSSVVGAAPIVRGVIRLLAHRDCRPLVEFPLPDGRRADVAAVDPRGGVLIVEVKSSVADFRADAKWPTYRHWCDSFYFAVDADFPQALLPADVGIIVADRFAGSIVRAAPVAALGAARRRALLIRFARTGAMRLAALNDPWLTRGEPER